MTNPQLITNLSYEDYDAIEALRWSHLKEIAKSPLHCKYAVDADKNDEPHFRIGRALHCAILEPEWFRFRFRTAPKVDRRTTAGKAEWLEFTENSKGVEILSQDEANTVKAMAAAINAEPAANELLSINGYAEAVITWNCIGIDCKARLDFLITEGRKRPAVIEIKTTARSADAFNFGFEARRRQYIHHAAWVQYGLASSGIARNDHIFIVVEKSPPYGVGVWRLPQRQIDRATPDVMGMLDTFAACVAKDRWPGYGSGDLEFPDDDKITFTNDGDDE